MHNITSLRRGPPPRDPGRAGRGLLWGALSLAIHGVVLLVLLGLVTEIPASSRATQIALNVEAPQRVSMVYLTPEQPAPRVTAPPRGAAAGRGEARALPRPQPRPQPQQAPGAPERVAGGGAPAGRRADTTAAVTALRPGTHRLLQPDYASGRLWIPPVDILDLGRLEGPGGSATGGETSVATLDSTVTARLRAFLDTMPADSFAAPSAPRWTTEINGKTWGIDRKWIYLGGLKLPAALLALLPVPASGNYDQSKAAADLMRIRQDILQAAQRAQTTAEFRQYVKELRKRMDEEREIKRRTGRDTIIP